VLIIGTAIVAANAGNPVEIVVGRAAARVVPAVTVPVPPRRVVEIDPTAGIISIVAAQVGIAEHVALPDAYLAAVGRGCDLAAFAAVRAGAVAASQSLALITHELGVATTGEERTEQCGQKYK
jgi:hypothetical protein